MTDAAVEKESLPSWSKILIFAVVLFALYAEWRAMSLRYFVNDDYQLIYTTWLRSTGQIPGKDFAIQSFHLLPEFLRPLMLLSGSDPEKLWILRIPFFMALAVLPGLVWHITRKIVGVVAAPFAAMAALLNWGVLERGLDIRPDVLIVVLVLLQLSIVVKRDLAFRHVFLVGLLSALMLMLRIKSVLFFPLIASWLVMREDFYVLNKNRWQGCLWLALFWGGLLGCIVLLIFISWVGLLPAFIKGNYGLAGLAAQHVWDSQIRLQTWALSCAQDGLWLVLLAGGVFIMVVKLGRKKLRLGLHLMALLATVIAYVYLNPALYAYSLVLLFPLLAPFVGLVIAEVLHYFRESITRHVFLVSIPVFGVVGPYVALLVLLATQPTNFGQIELTKALAKTSPDTHVFALEGIGLFRPSIYDWRLSFIALDQYRNGRISFVRQLDAARPEIVIRSYRIPGWLLEQDQKWLFSHYVGISPKLLVLGAAFSSGEVGSFSVARSAVFEVSGGGLVIDGIRYANGSTVLLRQGSHLIRGTDGRSVLRYYWPGGKALRPSAVPYLISPDNPQYIHP